MRSFDGETEVRHFFSFANFGPASVPFDIETFVAGFAVRPPSWPAGARHKWMVTVPQRLRAADRIMPRVYLPNRIRPGASDVLAAYYGLGEPMHGIAGAGRGTNAIHAVYPLTGVCILAKSSERPSDYLQRIADAERNAKGGMAAAQWRACSTMAENMLTQSQLAYRAAMRAVPEQDGWHQREIDGILSTLEATI